mgnify:CR=1 FL=1
MEGELVGYILIPTLPSSLRSQKPKLSQLTTSRRQNRSFRPRFPFSTLKLGFLTVRGRSITGGVYNKAPRHPLNNSITNIIIINLMKTSACACYGENCKIKTNHQSPAAIVLAVVGKDCRHHCFKVAGTSGCCSS